MQNTNRPTGMFGFTLVWLGQIISVLATNMSVFALTIWVFRKDRQRHRAWLDAGFLHHAAVDHHSVCRCDGGPAQSQADDDGQRSDGRAGNDFHPDFAGIRCVGSLASLRGGSLSRIGECFSMARLFRRDQHNDPKGKIWTCEWHDVADRHGTRRAGSHAGRCSSYRLFGLTGILSLDVATFILAILVLLFVHIPQPPRTVEGAQAQGNILKEAVFGFRYIFAVRACWGCSWSSSLAICVRVLRLPSSHR